MSGQQSSAFRFPCPACGGRIKAPRGQAGQKCRCPRCNAEVVAPAGEQDEGFHLSEVADRLLTVSVPPANLPAPENPAQAPAPSESTASPKTGGRTDVMGDQARKVFAQAEAEAKEIERAKPRLPERPFVTGVVSFLFEGEALLRWLVLAMLLQADASLLLWIVELGKGPGIAQVGAVLMTLGAALLSLLFVATAAASGLAILQDSASGCDKVENWPNLQITEWMMDVFYVVNSALAAALPGLFLGGTWMCMGGKVWSAINGGAISTMALFPVFLVSMVTEGSSFSIVSPVVWASLSSAPRLWGKFYLLSAGLGFALWLLAWGMAGSGFFLRGLCSAVAIAGIMLYFRLLGRLAWCLSELPRRS